MRGSKEQIQPPTGHSFRVLKWTDNLSDVECFTAPNKTMRFTGEGAHWHFHKEMELTLFMQGEGTRFVGDHIGFFNAGDLVLLGENLPHYWHTRGKSAGISVQWHFPDSHPFWGFPENFDLIPLFKQSSLGIRLSGNTAKAISKLLIELPKFSGHAQLPILMSAISIISTAPECEKLTLSAKSFDLTAEEKHQNAISSAVQYMVANFREELHLEELLSITGMSRATFSRHFKLLTSYTYSEFLNRLRLQAVCRDLKDSKRNIVDIAFSCGFTQISFFNRLFRRRYQLSPSSYRAKFQSEATP